MQGSRVFVASHILVDECLTLLLGVAVLRHLLERTLVKRRCGNVEMSALNHLRHEAIEQCHDQRVDVRAIDVGVGHDDNLVVAKLVDVGFAVAFAIHAEAYADALDDVHYRLGLKHTVPLYLLHVQNLTAQRQDGLEVTVAALLGAAACRVTLDEEYLAVLRVFVGAVGQLAGQSATRHRVLALYALTGLAGSDTGCGSQHHFVANHLCLLRMLLQVVGQCLAYSLLYGTCHLRVSELRLRLSLKLRFCHLDGDDGRQTLAEVLWGNLNLCLLNLL